MGGDNVGEKIEVNPGQRDSKKTMQHLQQMRLRYRDNFYSSKVARSGGLAPRMAAGRRPELCDALSRL
jgi:hypothetical protein